MQLMVQPNMWSCLPTAFAMALDVSLEEVLAAIGHDGSEVIWPDRPEPVRRRSFHIQEMIRFAYSKRMAVISFDAIPTLVPEVGGPEYEVRADLESVLYNCFRGVLTGLASSGSRHAVAWNGSSVYDPNGTKYDVELFMIETLWVVEPLR